MGNKLFTACENGEVDIVKKILETGVDVNLTHPKTGATPLWIACYNGQNKLIKLLLENKANANIADNEGITPLYACSKHGSLPGVKVRRNP